MSALRFAQLLVRGGSRAVAAPVRPAPKPSPVVHPVPAQREQAAPAPLTVWLLDQPTCDAYDRFVEMHPSGGLYHTLIWRAVLEQLGFTRAAYLAAMRADRFVGALPLVDASLTTPSRGLVSLPATPAAGPIFDERDTQAALWDRALTLARRRGAADITTTSFAPLTHAAAAAPPAVVRTRIFGLLALAAPAAHTGAGFARTTTGRAIDALAAARRPGVSASPADATAVVSALIERGARLRTTHLGSLPTPRCSAVWAACGGHTHVLHMAPSDLGPAELARLLYEIATVSAVSGVRWIDFPSPPAARDWVADLARHIWALGSQRLCRTVRR